MKKRKKKKMTVGEVVVGSILCLLMGTIFFFGSQYWDVPVQREDTVYVEATYSSCRVERNKHKKIVLSFTDYEDKTLDYADANDEELLRRIEQIVPGSKVEMLLHPNLDDVLELRQGSTVFLDFQNTARSLEYEHKADKILGLCLYALALLAVIGFIFDKLRIRRKQISAAKTGIEVFSPLKGTVVSLTDIPDEAYSSGNMGKGVGILPSEGKVYAPFDGSVELTFETNHAIGLESDEGIHLLIHIGLLPTELDGEYFHAHVSDRELFKKGDLLLEFDLEEIAKKYNTITAVLIVNDDEYTSVRGLSGITADLDTVVIRVHV